ncbi:hypothetical protein [Marinicellulosiphila megalodicopiae]|uniref:hypothetical protein n=1 Tax=Marinicellulosiphila megalodicopiae TaxID=2724896 RepID=UPI003BB110DC
MKQFSSLLILGCVKWLIVGAFIAICHEYSWFRYEFSFILSVLLLLTGLIYKRKTVFALFGLLRVRCRLNSNDQSL